MPGFIISNTDIHIALTENYAHSYIDKQKRVDNYDILVHTIDKFQKDKLFFENDTFFVVTEGVLLNKKNVLDDSKEITFAEWLWNGYKKTGVLFFKELVGCLSGAIYNKKEKKWVIWTNHTGDATIFWYKKGNYFIVGSQFDYVFDTLMANNIDPTFNKGAAYSMLTYGYMCDNRTYSNEIRRLMPGECLTYDGDNLNEEYYWKLEKKKYDMSTWSKDEIIDGLDEVFRKAVKLEFEKDQEYGYSHIADISGGFDARMVNWVAADEGYTPILNIHYSQSNSDEEHISKKMSEFLGNILLIRPLDDISFIYDIDRIVEMNYGLSLYSGITGGESLLRTINFQTYGIEHTGMIGDVVIGSFLRSEKELKKKELSGLYSTKLVSRMETDHIKKYSDFELQKIYIRGLLGACSSFMIRKKYTEPMAVFLNPDLLEYCMCIPVNYRANHNLYNEWVIKKYPSAAEFEWTYTGSKITEPEVWVKLKKLVKKGSALMLHKLKIRTYRQGMNPFHYWYKTKKEYRDFYLDYFEKNINCSAFDESLKNDLKELFIKGSPVEKSQVLTVLAVGKRYYSNSEEQ